MTGDNHQLEEGNAEENADSQRLKKQYKQKPTAQAAVTFSSIFWPIHNLPPKTLRLVSGVVT